MHSVRHLLLGAGGVIWLGLIGAGGWRLSAYKHTPGAAAVAMAQWPQGSALRRDNSGTTLVLVAHPRCPCTRASIAELSRVLAKSRGRVGAHVLFVIPSGLPNGWGKTDLWTTAAAIPGVAVHPDRGGVEAARFGAATSGQCFLFDAAGRRLFSGGITVARGHEGDNAGRDHLVRLISDNAPRGASEGVPDHPVFGCPLGERACPVRRPSHLPEGSGFISRE